MPAGARLRRHDASCQPQARPRGRRPYPCRTTGNTGRIKVSYVSLGLWRGPVVDEAGGAD